MFKTHVVISLLIGLFTYKFFSINFIVFIAIVMMAGSLPDIDMPKSKLGRKIKPISALINLFFGHRGITHSIFVPSILYIALFYLGMADYGAAFLLGYIGHLIGDAVSKEGINFLHPFGVFRVNGFVKVGGFLEYVIFIFLLGISILKLIEFV